MQDINLSIQKAQEAFTLYSRLHPHRKADFLEAIAKEIEALGEPLLETASKESNLPLARFVGERGRTLGQIRQFAQLVREGSWVEATLDSAMRDRLPAPKPDLRRMLIPLGPVAVFGASNFPLAFSTAGGDSISALASGCPVVYKEHPAHPETSKMVAGAIAKALSTCQLPEGVFQHVSGGVAEGQYLVQHRGIKAVGFTGSFQGGKAIYDLAQTRTEPIPVFAEMGSVNPIFIMPEVIVADPDKVAKTIVSSVTMGVGQFCTNPGLLFIPRKERDALTAAMKFELTHVPLFKMLHSGIAAAYRSKLKSHLREKEVHLHFLAEDTDPDAGLPALASVDMQAWKRNPHLQDEVFGPFTMLVLYDDPAELISAAMKLEGQLTCTIWGMEAQHPIADSLVQSLSQRCGRLLFGGAPTGVEVCPSMTHGGPYPSTTNSQSTSVGTYAIKRFTRPFTYQDAPEDFLPEELKNVNGLGIWRTINGELSKKDL
jgi:NADP-dependent aldehyde dehydrogenase